MSHFMISMLGSRIVLFFSIFFFFWVLVALDFHEVGGLQEAVPVDILLVIMLVFLSKFFLVLKTGYHKKFMIIPSIR